MKVQSGTAVKKALNQMRTSMSKMTLALRCSNKLVLVNQLAIHLNRKKTFFPILKKNVLIELTKN